MTGDLFLPGFMAGLMAGLGIAIVALVATAGWQHGPDGREGE